MRVIGSSAAQGTSCTGQNGGAEGCLSAPACRRTAAYKSDRAAERLVRKGEIHEPCGCVCSCARVFASARGRARPAFGRCIHHRSDSQPMRQDTQGGRCSCSASCRFGNRKPLCVRTFRAVRFSLVKKDLHRCTKTFRIVLVVRVCGCKSKPGAGKRIHVSRHAGVRAVIMAYLRSKSSENRVKASVGAKTRSAGRHLQNFHKTQKRV